MPCSEHGDEGDKGEADHQGRGRGRCSLRVALRVLRPDAVHRSVSEHAREVERPLRRPARHLVAQPHQQDHERKERVQQQAEHRGPDPEPCAARAEGSTPRQPVRQRPERPDEHRQNDDRPRADRTAAVASGRTRRDEKSATPRKIRSAPTPMQMSTCVVPRLLPKRPYERAAKPSAVRAQRAGGAEMGETRLRQGRALAHGRDRGHARRADRGPQAREQRHDDPDEQRNDDRPRLEDETAVRQREANRVEELEEALGEAKPRKSPTRDASTATTSDSTMIDQSTCRRDRRACGALRTRASAGRS